MLCNISCMLCSLVPSHQRLGTRLHALTPSMSILYVHTKIYMKKKKKNKNKKKELSSGVVACICLVSMTDYSCITYVCMYMTHGTSATCTYMYIHRSTGSSGYRELYTFSCVCVYMCAMCPPLLPQALDKMEAEWDPVNMEIVPYKETGTYIMKSGEETAQMLDDHIVMAQAMSFSPYKKPFELRITTWENKLRLTQV